MNYSISLENLSYSIQGKRIVDNVNFGIEKNKIFIISGHNGAGKTTLLRLMAGIITPTSGKINYYFSNKKIKHIKAPLSDFIFQKPIFLNRTVFENLKHALCSVYEDIREKEVIELINQTLIRLRIDHLSNIHAKNISLGEQQIVAMARAIIVKPQVLFCDEPTNSMDYNNKNFFEENILEISEKLPVIIVTHDQEQAKRLSNNILTMENGKFI